MMMKGLQRLWKLCDKIGLKTLGDIKQFYEQERQQGEDLITTLERYAADLGDFDASKNQNK